MLYPENLEEKISFDKIREMLKSFCLSSLGIDYVGKMQFSTDFELVKKLINQTEEFRQIQLNNEPFPGSDYLNVFSFLPKAGVPGSFLSEEEFHDLKRSLTTILNCLKFSRSRSEKYPHLAALAQNIQLEGSLLNDIGKIIDEKGKIRNNASPELGRIRSSIQSEQIKLRKVLNTILRNAIDQGITGDDVSLTIRNGRMVIPVNAANKRQIKGFIQDESSTGQTVYIEPEQALEVNNQIKELEYRERREIIRLLIELTDKIRPHLPDLYKAYHYLGIIDFIRAKAKLALHFKAEYCNMTSQPEIDWQNAVHPLLLVSHRKQQKPVVPLNVRLDKDQRILIVSGPNAGGKSVCLKTIGLVQYMFQCGLMVPVRESSTLGIFRHLFIDIGDEQSIENDLSTYSSHLTNMRHFVNFTDKKSLFLIDEFGTGTEPQIGGAIAEAILEQLHQHKAFGVITTHYTNLKKFADMHPGVANAAMRFDLEKLEPLYELEIGKPGSSFALEIAQKIGLPKAILSKARQYVGVEQVKFERLLGELEIEKKTFKEKMAEIEQKDKKLQQSLEEYTGLKILLDNNKKKIINDARAEAEKIVGQANQKVENTIRLIKENKAEKQLTKKVRQELEEFRETVKPEKEQPAPPPEIKVVGGEIKEGDWVRIKGQETVGQVLKISGKDYELIIGQLKSKVKKNRLEKISRKEAKKSEATSVSSEPIRSKGIDLNARMASFSSNLDVRGKRTEQAITEIDQFIDDALLLGQRDLRVIHGKGDGILRGMIRNHLKNSRIIRSVRDEHIERGGAGVTLVELK